jgi:hypothetical protein
MRNVHQRVITAPADVVGALLDRLAGENDPLWPTPPWPPIRFEGGLAVGNHGGHGRIRYFVAEYEPGRRLRFQFEPSSGLDGYHQLVVESRPDGSSRLTHVLEGRLRGTTRIVWPLLIRRLHNRCIEDLFDRAESAVIGASR